MALCLGYVSAASATQAPPGSGEDSDDNEDGDEEPVLARDRLPVTPPRSAGTEELFGSHEDLPVLQRALMVGPCGGRDDNDDVATSHLAAAPSNSEEDRRPLVTPRPPAPVPKKIQRAPPAKKKGTFGGASGSGLHVDGATASGAHEAAGAQRQMGLYQQAIEKRFKAVD